MKNLAAAAKIDKGAKKIEFSSLFSKIEGELQLDKLSKLIKFFSENMNEYEQE